MATPPREVELKLTFDPADARRIMRRLSRARGKTGPARQSLVSVYFDTPDFALSRNGVSLRVRRVGKKHIQTIKIADREGGALFDRAEWEQDVEGFKPDASAAKGTPVESLLNGQRSTLLRPMFETRIRRTEYRGADDGTAVAVALDQGEIDTGERQSPVCELEFELVRGEPAGLFRLAKKLGELVPLRLCVRSKADRGYEMLRNESDPVDTAADVHLAPTMSSEEAFQVIARGCLRQLIANEPAMCAGNAEALHQMRIALRRLRSAMSVFSELVADAELGRFNTELKWITAELGGARDLDVLVAEVLHPLREQSPQEPGVAAFCRNFAQRRARAHKHAVESVRSARFRALALDVAEWIEIGPWTRNDDDLARLRREQAVALRAADELAGRWKKLTKKSKSPKRLGIAERHKLRIRAKKLRYAVEFFADVFPGKKRAKRCGAALSSLKDLQDALGALNDVATREELMSRAALAKRRKSKGAAARERAFAAGMVVGAQEAGIEHMLAAAESAYAKLLEVKPFWT